mmetsp:Transcript_13379/g.34077  ORF Transcript_13379/g.34077 Transcript_13379/m.34077 type:complete len:247 (+) Transcript_13379:803-1543(+)
MGRTATMPADHDFIEPGAHAIPRSSLSASSCVTHTPTRSPWPALLTDFLNIWMLFTLRSTLSSGNSMVWLTAIEPLRIVPVSTVPCPLMGKQWSIAKCSAPSALRSGSATRARIASMSTSMPTGASVAMLRRSASSAPSTKGRAATEIIGASLNLVCESALATPFFILSSFSVRVASGSRSCLLSTTISSSAVSSPTTRHSAVCVWMPLVRSITSSIMSMICAPPITVRISDAWPGQSTSVNCSCS